MNETVVSSGKPSNAFRMVALVSLLWSFFGAAMYLLAKFKPEATQAALPPNIGDYLQNMPLWAHIGWSVWIWGSVLGSVLLRMRSRHAVTAFLVAAIGALASHVAQAQAGALTVIEPIVTFAAIGLQWWWSRQQVALGNLR